MTCCFISETFGTPQAQAAWSRMIPDGWWMIFGSCSPELKSIAIKVLSQTTSATNCERNRSTFSYIHTKKRNRLTYNRLHRHVYTFYNMKLKMRTEMRSREEIEASFNLINFDNIFQEDDPLFEWIEEMENPALDGAQNAEWLPIIDTNDENENMEVDSDNVGSDENSGDLCPPSDDGGNDGGNVEAGGSDDEGEQMHNDPYEEMPLHRRDHNLIDVTMHRSGMVHSSDSFNGNSRTESRSRKGKKKQNITLEDASSSSIAQSFSDFSIDETSQSSQ
ncbi:hypothetical protein Lal_00015567 [Lupinus albus]|nr:hypothetical protein Lal_00015567 [Lupinus albus]